MVLADDIRDLAGRSLAALDDCHDYFTHTKVVWRLLQQIVGEGRKFTLLNKTTGTVIDQQALVNLTQRYVTDYLASFTFQHFVSLFEEFFFDLLHLGLVADPGSLAKKQLEFGIVLKAPDRAAITHAVVDKELNELKYERVTDWFEYLEKLVKLGCPTTDEMEKIAEIKASRDILVHNKGMVNASYLLKAGKRARYKEGERLKIPEPYHRESWQTIGKVIRDISDAAIKKA
jgi:hypothetical protein